MTIEPKKRDYLLDKITQILVLVGFFVFLLGTMNLKPDIQAMVQRQALAWETQNVSAIVNDFAPNGIFIAGGYTFEGRSAIEKAATDYFQQFNETKVTIKRIVIDGNQGAVEWS